MFQPFLYWCQSPSWVPLSDAFSRIISAKFCCFITVRVTVLESNSSWVRDPVFYYLLIKTRFHQLGPAQKQQILASKSVKHIGENLLLPWVYCGKQHPKLQKKKNQISILKIGKWPQLIVMYRSSRLILELFFKFVLVYLSTISNETRIHAACCSKPNLCD